MTLVRCADAACRCAVVLWSRQCVLLIQTLRAALTLARTAAVARSTVDVVRRDCCVVGTAGSTLRGARVARSGSHASEHVFVVSAAAAQRFADHAPGVAVAGARRAPRGAPAGHGAVACAYARQLVRRQRGASSPCVLHMFRDPAS
jgi:hypothetical protein